MNPVKGQMTAEFSELPPCQYQIHATFLPLVRIWPPPFHLYRRHLGMAPEKYYQIPLVNHPAALNPDPDTAWQQQFVPIMPTPPPPTWTRTLRARPIYYSYTCNEASFIQNWFHRSKFFLFPSLTPSNRDRQTAWW